MKTPKSILDRRRSIRIDESLPFKLGHEGYEVEATSLNISYHGAMFLVEKEIKLMTQLSLGITIPHSPKPHVVVAKGVVVRRDRDEKSGKYLVAVFFSDIKPKDEKILKEFIDSRIKRD